MMVEPWVWWVVGSGIALGAVGAGQIVWADLRRRRGADLALWLWAVRRGFGPGSVQTLVQIASAWTTHPAGPPHPIVLALRPEIAARCVSAWRAARPGRADRHRRLIAAITGQPSARAEPRQKVGQDRRVRRDQKVAQAARRR